MNYASSVYMFVCVCLCAEKMTVVSVQIQESSADSAELQESNTKLDEVNQLINSNREIIYRKDPPYFEKVGTQMKYPTKFQMLFSGLYSPRLPFGMLFDLVKRHDDQAAYSNKLVGLRASLPLTYTNGDKITTYGNGEAQNEVFGPSSYNGLTKLGKDLVFDAENERQRNGFNAKAIEENENQDKENVGPFVIQTVAKRQHSYCDISKATLNMIVEYFKFRTICGKKASKVRFGLGK